MASTHASQPLARENADFPFELRELRFGLGARPTHRALFVVRPECVYVVMIRSLVQDDITWEDVIA
ncbi:hypothetical protein [Botrimarina sp.]|uniref:hypothetical protein n=1 Tax=Botrimarina sp. TaxID=2795802 RepID=UPI0032EBAAD7